MMQLKNIVEKSALEKYLTLDRRLLNPQAMENVQIQTAKLKKDSQNNPLFIQDKPWEVRIDNGYPNVLYDKKEGIFRCYYTLFTSDQDTEETDAEERCSRAYRPRMDRITSLAYAESRDGIHWEKPSLNMVEWRGTRENNLLFLYAHGTGVMIDEHDSDPSRRYKLVTKVDIPECGAHMAVGFSPDGLHWSELIPWPEYNPPADSHNLPFWNKDEGCYMLLSRIWKDGIRITTLSRSSDFIHWSEPEETLRGRGFETQIYSMPAFYWNNLYLGLASVIHEGDRLAEDFDCVDCELTWAVSPEKFDFAAPGQSVIARGSGSYPDGEFDNSCIYASPPAEGPDGRLWVYYMGGNGKHTNFRESSLGRSELLPDKFAAYVQKKEAAKGVLTTNTLEFWGPVVEVLAEPVDSQKPVNLKASIQAVWADSPYDGFSIEESTVQEKDGWYRIGWEREYLPAERGCIRLEFENLKIWAVRGTFRLYGHRLWEGADLENENK